MNNYMFRFVVHHWNLCIRVLSDSDSAYVVFLRQGGNALLNLVGNDDYDVTWFNPRTGETTDGGSVEPNGRLDSPPSQQNQNWAVVLTR